MSEYDLVNRNVLSRVRKVARDGANLTSGGRRFHTWGQQPKPEAERGSRCSKSEVIGDFEGRQRKWTGQGTTVHSRGGPCTPGRQLWARCAQEHAASEGWWVRQRHDRSDASWKSAARLRWGLTADDAWDRPGGLSRRRCRSLVASLPEWPCDWNVYVGCGTERRIWCSWRRSRSVIFSFFYSACFLQSWNKMMLLCRGTWKNCFNLLDDSLPRFRTLKIFYLIISPIRRDSVSQKSLPLCPMKIFIHRNDSIMT